MRFKFKRNVMVWLPAFMCLLCTGPIWAQEEGTTQSGIEGRVFNLGEVVVTGKGETITEVTTVETLDREQLDLTDATDVSKAIQTLPGVAVSVGTRNEAYLNVRGFNQRYVPIFYDGIPLYIPWDGYADASQLTTGNVSQITLSKGAASTLYGANTMGGVINIVSMKPQRRFEGSYKLEVGENGRNATVNLGSRLDRLYFQAGISGLDSDDYKMSDDFNPIPGKGWYEDGGRRDNSDNKSVSGSFKVGFTPAEGHEYALGIQHVTNERGLPPNIYVDERQRFWRFTEWEKTTYYFIGDTRLTDNLSAKTRIYHDTYYNVLDSYDDETYSSKNKKYAFHSTYDDYTNGGSLVLRSTHLPRNTLSFAFHYKYDVHEEQDDSGDPWERYKSETISVGLEDDIKITDNLGVVLGVNYDLQKEKEAFDGQDKYPLRDDDDSWNGLIGVHYRFKDDTGVHASVARKSRFPTLKELYSGYLGRNIANPDLEKEQSTNYEIGLERPLPKDSHAGISFFYSDFKDKIGSATVLVDGESYDTNKNIDKARFQGFEVSFKTECLPRNQLGIHYTYLDAEDRSDNPADHLEETPKHSLYVSDLFKVNDWFSLFAKAGYNKGQWEEKSMPDKTLQWVELDSYWTVDVKAMAEISRYATVELGVRNLFDEDYETGYGFPREGRAFFIGLRGTF
ncbi:MAG: TonB-dependent receptor plug domain-containing protein [Desulfatiglandales bacterium]